jgi:hypothetical protein
MLPFVTKKEIYSQKTHKKISIPCAFGGPRHAGVCWGLIYATDGDTNLNTHRHKTTLYPIHYYNL